MPGLPVLRAFERHPPQPVEADPALAVRRELTDDLLAAVAPGARIAVALGSRGLASGPAMAAELIAALRRAGAKPFLIPAIGSHGGATAQGQAAMLDQLGLGGDALGCEVRAEMETEISRLLALIGGSNMIVPWLMWIDPLAFGQPILHPSTSTNPVLQNAATGIRILSGTSTSLVIIGRS